MVSTSEIGASITPIPSHIQVRILPFPHPSVISASRTSLPSNPQVRILPFPHHSMLLPSNHTLEAKAVTSNPHPLFFLSLTNRLDAHEPLNTQSTNRQLPHHY